VACSIYYVELMLRIRGCCDHCEDYYGLVLICVSDLMSPHDGGPIGCHTFEDSVSKKYVIGMLSMKGYWRDLTVILV
jgi:hypothetical protein